MKSNVQITASKKEFKNGQKGYEVFVDGMDGKLNAHMNFTNPLKAMRYMFILSKRLELNIDTIALTAVSIAYQKVKEAEQKIVNEAASAAGEVAQQVEGEPEEAPAPKGSENKNELSPMLKQFKDLKKKHPDAILLFRCGDFYETYEEDAKATAEILGITLTKRNGEAFYMAGFPYHALDTYLPKLIRAGRRVAICDQIEEPKTKKAKRNVTDMVTPAQTEMKFEEGAK